MMISIKWSAVIVWSITGLVALLKPWKVSKLEYFLAWLCLMCNLIERAINA